MRTFTCLITDDRYSAPQLAFLMADDESRARELALRQLSQSRHYRGVEVLEHDRVLFTEDKSFTQR